MLNVFENTVCIFLPVLLSMVLLEVYIFLNSLCIIYQKPINFAFLNAISYNKKLQICLFKQGKLNNLTLILHTIINTLTNYLLNQAMQYIIQAKS